jgi:hypothetical protein
VPAGAATNQLSGVGIFDTTGVCPPPRAPSFCESVSFAT